MSADLDIIFEDAHYLVVNKPSGLTSVPGKGVHALDSLTTRVLARHPEAPSHPAVHRLDMDTSGVMLFALHAEAHKAASRLFEQREVRKRYVAQLEGEVEGGSGTIELPFRLDPDDRPRQIYDPEYGKWGTTHWRLLERRTQGSLVEFEPVTGRTHQLRLHASHQLGLGIPIIGDCLYGSGARHGELRLHACYLALRHPITYEDMQWESQPEWY